MMREQVSQVVATLGQALDPLRGLPVLLRALRPRDLPVRDVAHEHMAERELILASDRRPPLAPDELLANERVQGTLQRGGIAVVERRERPGPEDLAEHSAVLEGPLFL